LPIDFPFVFLGVSFKHISRTVKMHDKLYKLEGYVPYPANIEKYAASFVFPTRQKTSGTQVMERIYGLMLAGAWLTPLAPLFRKEYERHLVDKKVPKYVDTTYANFSEIEDIAEVLLSHSPTLPSDDLICAMYLMEPEDFAEFYEQVKPVNLPKVAEPPELGFELEDLAAGEELSSMFGSMKINVKHAGQAKLPKPKVVEHAASENSDVLRSLRVTAPVLRSKPVGSVKKGSKLASQLKIIESDEYEDDFESGADSPSDLDI
jgi:hypothetical protein